jgi:hypothetical protein
LGRKKHSAVRAITGLLILLTVSACTTQAQIEATKFAQKARVTLDAYNACLAPIEADSRYARIYEKLGVAKTSDPNRVPSQVQLTDETKLSNEDIALGLNWYAEIQHCDLPAIASLGEIDPEFQSYFARARAERTDVINEIVTTKPSFGRINQRLYALRLNDKAEATQLAQKIRARLVVAHQRELAEREAVAASVAELALDAVLTLSSRQVILSRSAARFAAVYPKVPMHEINAIKCSPSMKTALDIAVQNAKNEITQGYGTRGLSIDPRSNTSLAQQLAAIDARATASRSAAGCPS